MNIRTFIHQSILVTLLVLAMIGCQTANPVDPVNSTGTAALKSQSVPSEALPPLVGNTSNTVQNLNFITLPRPLLWPPSASARTASGTISAANGGTVNLSYSYLGPLILPITVKATLTIPPGAIPQNTTITMTMDQSRVLVYFSPDGLVFSKPALLDVKVTGLTLSNLLFGQQAGCYWYDSNKQIWVQMPAQSIVSDLLHLTFVAQSAQVPHFSRYGFGR
ncbi:MAG TPA: hypothetical protein VES59_10790 [Bacteroidota bacterium]|nr:hypothetical protein [Bacteroidota bacterium]